jgi:hypothetical protein
MMPLEFRNFVPHNAESTAVKSITSTTFALAADEELNSTNYDAQSYE